MSVTTAYCFVCSTPIVFVANRDGYIDNQPSIENRSYCSGCGANYAMMLIQVGGPTKEVVRNTGS